MDAQDSDARIYKITSRKHKTVVRYTQTASIEDFEYVFEKKADPKIVLKDEVSLFLLDESKAVYVDCGEVDVFSDTTHAFLFETQYHMAERFIILPIESFHRISETIPLPTIPIIHMFHHGRCGSTLFSRVFQAIPGSFVVNDSKAFVEISFMSSNNKVLEETTKQFVKKAFLNLVKHASFRKSKLIFIKLSSMCTFIADVIMDIFPGLKSVYLYRQPIKFIESRQKLMGVNKVTESDIDGTVNFRGYEGHRIMLDVPSCSKEHLMSLSFYAKLSIRWIYSVACFNELIKKGYKIKSLKYEDFLQNPRKMLMLLESFTEAPIQSEVVNIEEVLTRDSQDGSTASTRGRSLEELKKYVTPLNNELRAEIDNLCDFFNVPRCGCDVKLSNPLC